jgi:signal transduction histidine kinase
MIGSAARDDMDLSFELKGVAFPLFTVFVLTGLGLYLGRFRHERGGFWLSLVQFGKAATLLALLASAQTANRLLSHALQTLGFTMFIVVLWLGFKFIDDLGNLPATAAKIAGRLMLALIPFSSALYAADYWTHGLTAGATAHGYLGHGWTWIILFVQWQLITLCTTGAILFWIVRSSGVRRLQAEAFLLQAIISRALTIVPLIHSPLMIESLPLDLLVAGVLSLWAFDQWRNLNEFSLAKERALRDSSDGVLLFDEKNYCVECNRIMEEFLAGLRWKRGESLSALCRVWPELNAFEGGSGDLAVEARRRSPQGDRWFLIRRAQVYSERKVFAGSIFTLVDITREKRQQALLLEQEKSLLIAREREYLGHEMHDGQGQVLGYLSLKMIVLRKLLERHEYQELDLQLSQLSSFVGESNTGFRESIAHLRAPLEDGLMPALRKQLEWYRSCSNLRTELQLNCEWSHDLLAPVAEAQLLRILQEAMANVRKSAQASRITLTVERHGGNLSFSVTDDGKGFDIAAASARAGHHGLRIMQERAAQIKAQLSIESAPGQGTTVRVLAPAARTVREEA